MNVGLVSELKKSETAIFPQWDQKPTFFSVAITRKPLMPIKILAFAGSPRRHGNSEILLDWVLG